MANVLETVRDDDFVEYYLFIRTDIVPKGCEECVNYLNNLNDKILEWVEQSSKQYIWHKDRFNLIPRYCPNDELWRSLSNNSKNVPLPPHLYGVTHYGDNIEDEWFIVYLLRELSKKFNELIIRVIDSDGEFLLIEAAEYLPKWASPENCDQRVYISNGDVHIIPLSNENKKSIAVIQALEQISRYPTATIANSEVNSSISSRIHGYPEKIKENLHKCHAYLPLSVAYLLKYQPSLIAPAVLSFCHRDPLDIRACRMMKHFPPKDRITRSVIMTKCLYAMLVHQKFIPERKAGWNLVESTDSQYKAQLLGVKIACGFEILASQAKSAVKDTSVDLTYDKRWHQYKSALIEKGYFKNLYEGSNGYKVLEDQAKDYYLTNIEEYLSSPSIGQRINTILNRITDDELSILKQDIADLEPEDDEKWLNVSACELDQILEQKFGIKNSQQVPSSFASSFSDTIKRFLNQTSDVNGAEFSNNHLSDDSSNSEENEKISNISPNMLTCGPDVMCPTNDDKFSVSSRYKKKKTKTISKNNVNFEPEKYEAALRNILDFKVPEDNWNESDSSDMDSYGSDCDDLISNGKLENHSGPSISNYMDQMDRELASTSLGSSFIKKSTSSSTKLKKNVRIAPTATCEDDSDYSDVEHFEPVDIDVNAFQNILQSYHEQLGLPGPAGNLLGPAGLNIVQNPPPK
ncbi:protein ecdysoneless [Daktulosphaira vitifoliae]|uniref:protein ecdysoneless n=1 Tax=Daktulosphaira vitifoliae TaxID=58002 RepID=UPI0021A9C249|nr:protein ecdysoneless [Daktulosphaira vitifoliae]